MAMICYHASHEQFPPSQLLKLAVMAEKAGFEGIHSSDHFHPWSHRQGESGFSFAWMGAAMQATQLPFSMVCAPGQRYHPAIVAQAIATLAEMFPSRFNVELGSGEAINEKITGDPWPAKSIRNERLFESVTIIRKLLNGEEVNQSGHVTVKNARLYTLPDEPPLLMGAAISEETSGWVGSWADGLITTGDDDLDVTAKKLEAFRKGGGEGKPFYLQLSFSYAKSPEEAVKGAYEQWRSNLVSVTKLANLTTPGEFDELAETISMEDVKNSVKCFTSIADLLHWISSYNELGPSRIILHNVHPDQEFFISHYAKYHASQDILLRPD